MENMNAEKRRKKLLEHRAEVGPIYTQALIFLDRKTLVGETQAVQEREGQGNQ